MSAGEGDFFSRWSRRKHASRRAEPAADAAAPIAPDADAQAAQAIAPVEPGPVADVPPPLPALESLTSESDFTPFMRPDVDAGVRRAALKTLFQDPRFNVMDGLDVYIDDYSKPDPLPEGWLEQLKQVARLGHYQPPPEPAEGAAAIEGVSGNGEAPAAGAMPAPDAAAESRAAQESAKAEASREPDA